jgi:hypothetical protein
MQLELNLYNKTLSGLLKDLREELGMPGITDEQKRHIAAEYAIEITNKACGIGRFRDLTFSEISVVDRFGAKHYVGYDVDGLAHFKKQNLIDTLEEYEQHGIPVVRLRDIRAMELQEENE